MSDNNEIFGCFVSGPSTYYDDTQITIELALKKGKEFRTLIWGDKGICDLLKTLKYNDYGIELKLILFKFYLNPIPYELENLKEIDSYIKREKSIGIPIIINDDNFFFKNENERINFIKNSLLKKMNLLHEVIVNKKLDTKFDKLKFDLNSVLQI